MTLRPRVLLLGATIAMALVAAFACTSGGPFGGHNSPTGSPTNPQVDTCKIVWWNTAQANVAHQDLFQIDAPLADWVTGTAGYAVNSPVGLVYLDKDPTTQTSIAAAAAICTAGSFDLVLGNATATSASIAFFDGAPQPFYALNQTNGTIGAYVGTGGAGTFHGVWSDPAGTAPIPGTGTVTVVWEGTTLTLGQQGSYAICYRKATP